MAALKLCFITLAVISVAMTSSGDNDTQAEIERQRRKGISSVTMRWPNAEVPYELRACFTDRQKQTLYAAMADYHRYTCVRFKLAGNSNIKVSIRANQPGCFSMVGYLRRLQTLNLEAPCRNKGTMIHEMMHALGCYHEQSRPDRDDYVTIQRGNVLKGRETNFHKFSRDVIPDWGVPYSYQSVMHYGATAFSKNGRSTIIAKNSKFQRSMGQRIGFAYEDIVMVNKMYNCNRGCSSKIRCKYGFLGPDCRCWCKGSLRNPVRYCNGEGGPGAGPKVPRDLRAPRYSTCSKSNGK